MEPRRAHLGDISDLAALGAATFTASFGHLYQPEDLTYFVENSHSENNYLDALNKTDEPIWVIADKDRLVAYLKLCPNQLPCDPPLPKAIELSRIYVLPEFQKKGLGEQLLGVACQWAVDRSYPEMVLSVFSENYGGQRFYARHGFEKIGEYDFPVGQHLDREWIMRKILT